MANLILGSKRTNKTQALQEIQLPCPRHCIACLLDFGTWSSCELIHCAASVVFMDKVAVCLLPQLKPTLPTRYFSEGKNTKRRRKRWIPSKTLFSPFQININCNNSVFFFDKLNFFCARAPQFYPSFEKFHGVYYINE